MKLQFLRFFALLSFATACAASNEAANPALDAAKKEAASRYSEDQKICADETTSSRRMQCLRDAKEEYSRAMNAAEAKPAAESRQAAESRPAAEIKPSATPIAGVVMCNDCGKVTAVRVMEKEGETGAAGIIGGAVLGGLLGNQIGRGRGRDVATVAGVAGGAYAGNRIEGKMKATKTWAISVRFDNASERTFNFESDPGLIAGDTVRASGSSIVRR